MTKNSISHEVTHSILECHKKFLGIDHQQCGTWEILYYLVEVLHRIAPSMEISKVEITDEVGCEHGNHEGYTKGIVTVHFEQTHYMPQCAVEIYRKIASPGERLRTTLIIGGRYLCCEPPDMYYAVAEIVSVIVERGRQSSIPLAFNPTTVLALFHEIENQQESPKTHDEETQITTSTLC